MDTRSDGLLARRAALRVARRPAAVRPGLAHPGRTRRDAPADPGDRAAATLGAPGHALARGPLECRPAAVDRSARLALLLRGDLDWIVMRCLEKDRRRRYATASALAADIEHHLRDEPVSAAAPGVVYVLRKFARRHRTAFAVGATVVVILAAASIVSTVAAVRATRAERLAADRLGAELAARAEAERCTPWRNSASNRNKRRAPRRRRSASSPTTACIPNSPRARTPMSSAAPRKDRSFRTGRAPGGGTPGCPG